MDVPFIPGSGLTYDGPLARFLPPLELGIVGRLLESASDSAGVVLDPFGAAPPLALEAARAGRPVLVACNNPITRFILKHLGQPFSVSDLQSALAALGALAKDGGRLEPFVLDLYRTTCSQCGASVPAEYFVWNRDLGVPSHRAYACEGCGHAAEEPSSLQDVEQARSFESRSLQHALALEQVAPPGDPERGHAEAALAVYPGRALYALITVVNKVEQLSPEADHQAALQALLLTAFDSVDSMWAHPEGRHRPKQLSASPHFREMNVWRALEQGIGLWASDQDRVVCMEWQPSDPLQPGQVSVFPGPARALAGALPELLEPLVVTVPPRPNQAFWTLSALWAAWLWGRQAAAPVKSALRRRRYDWAWHAAALRTAMAHLQEALPVSTSLHMLIPESEPGYVAACIAASEAAGWSLSGRAFRHDEHQTQLGWRLSEPAPAASSADWPARVPGQIAAGLRRHSEPAVYERLHAHVWTELAQDRLLAPIWESVGQPPLTPVHQQIAACLEDRRAIVRLDQRADPETGLYWLTHEEATGAPHSDVVEESTVEAFRQRNEWPEGQLEVQICTSLQGMETPDRSLLRVCLSSYADGAPGGFWRLRPEDDQMARQQDQRDISTHLKEMGARLGYEVRGEDPIEWVGPDGEVTYTFVVQVTARLPRRPMAQGRGLTHVLPGGRAALVAEKARRDPRLQEALAAGLRVVKYRHIRRLAAEATLTQQNFDQRLAIDPPEHQDPQLPLL